VSSVISAIGEAMGMKPDDRVIAEGLLTAAKLKATAYCAAVLETTNPDLRRLLTTHLTDALAEHERCTRLAIERGWYRAHASPEDLVSQSLQDARHVLDG
jgi:similar to spore coat protein